MEISSKRIKGNFRNSPAYKNSQIACFYKKYRSTDKNRPTGTAPLIGMGKEPIEKKLIFVGLGPDIVSAPIVY